MILIDTPRWHGGYYWSHLVSDTSDEELHTFAARIGLKAAWFQGDHYDVRGDLRMKALRAGATQVRPRDVLAALKARGLRCGPGATPETRRAIVAETLDAPGHTNRVVRHRRAGAARRVSDGRTRDVRDRPRSA